VLQIPMLSTACPITGTKKAETADTNSTTEPKPKDRPSWAVRAAC
jgi:hypothetical protein